MQKPGLFGMNGFLLFLHLFFIVAAQAQQAGSLILIDAENKQSFTVRIGDQLYTSSSHGHLALSRLKDSVYHLDLVFPKKNPAGHIYPVTVKGKDLGFLLKRIDSSWVLFNWQTNEMICPVFERDSSRILEMGIKRNDGFSRLMAAVVNDTALLYNTYTGPGFGQDSISTVKTETLPPIAVGQPPPADHQPPVVIHKPVTTVHSIRKIREVNLKISRKMVFLDKGADGKTDTIILFVYYEKENNARKKKAAEDGLSIKETTTPDSTVTKEVREKNKPDPKTSASACGQIATERDVDSLRSAILNANSEQEKIDLASVAFVKKCYSVSQVRLLASLFVSDKNRYKLMDAAKGHIADRDHFRELVDMYTDKNFQKKFLVMAEKRS